MSNTDKAPRSGMPRFILTALILVLLIGCNVPQKVDGWIADRYGRPVRLQKPRPTDYFTISSPLVTKYDSASRTMKGKEKVLFLLFYWRIEHGLTTTLNARVPVNLFANAFTTYANSVHLKEKLNGHSLEIVLEKVPERFSFRHEDRNILVILGIVSWHKIYMLPETNDMVMQYSIDGGKGKTGRITLPDQNKISKVKFFEKLSTAYTKYLDAYEENIKQMAKSAVDQIMSEL